MFDYLMNSIINLGGRIIKLEKEMAVMEKILAERDRVLHAIPACKVHGDQCVPPCSGMDSKTKAILPSEN